MSADPLVRPAGEEPSAADTDPDPRPDGEGERVGSAGRAWRTLLRPRGPWLPVAIALVLALAGTGLTIRTVQLRDDPATANRALTDIDATTRVIGDVSNALSKVFSYSYTNTAATEQAARQVLAGAAYSQYERLFGQVLSQAPRQRLTLTTHVVRAGVTGISGDTARLLVFLDQVTTRDGRRAGTTAAAQLSVTARLQDGHWRITDIKAD